MTRTLHRYITRDFLRVMVLALLAFTLIVTIFAVIEPLRKRGLSLNGAAMFFLLTLPSVVSMTLPIATLFAGTIVYGRFSQDNEYLASRASGLSTIRVLAPALVIGLIVTVISLVLNNWVTPVMVNLARGPLTENIEGIVYGQLQRQGYIKMKDYVIHADTVRLAERQLEGVVVVAEPQGHGETTIVAAQTANPHFTEQNKQNYITLELRGASIIRGQTSKIEQEYIPPQTLPLEQATEKDDLALYNLGELMEFLNEPTKSKSIQREMDRARRRLVSDDLARELADAIGKTNTYDRLEDNDATYAIQAGGATVDAKSVVTLTPAPAAPGEARMVRVRRTPKPVAPGQPSPPAETIVAPFAEVTSEWQAWSSPKLYVSAMRGNKTPPGPGLYIVRIELYGDAKTPVTVTSDEHLDHPSRLPRWTRAEMFMPPEILTNAKKPGLAELRRSAVDPGMQKVLDSVTKRQIPSYRARVLAEINLRATYGLSCFGMVAMGAALGLLFRGGQLLSGFAITLAPSTLVICLAVAGKEMLRNSKLAATAGGVATGLGIMWSGTVALLLACLVLYAWLSRK